MSFAAATQTFLPADLQAYWMPFTSNRAFKQNPRIVASAKDMHYFTPEGRAILDGTAGLWCANAGHSRRRSSPRSRRKPPNSISRRRFNSGIRRPSPWPAGSPLWRQAISTMFFSPIQALRRSIPR